ncbi:MAG: hypothetical protein WAX07_03215 [Candidatus Altiarchaeia archaeon]
MIIREYASETGLKEKGRITTPSRIMESMNLEGREFLVYASREEIILKPKNAGPLQTMRQKKCENILSTERLRRQIRNNQDQTGRSISKKK